MNKKTDSNGSGLMISISLLGLIFIILKLTSVIEWRWWWVTLPFWIVPALGLLVLMIKGRK